MPYKDLIESGQREKYNDYMKGYMRARRAAQRNAEVTFENLQDHERTHSAEDYLRVLNEMIDATRIDFQNFTAPQRARTVALLIDTALRVLKAADHEKRIAELEQLYIDVPLARPVFEQALGKLDAIKDELDNDDRCSKEEYEDSKDSEDGDTV